MKIIKNKIRWAIRDEIRHPLDTLTTSIQFQSRVPSSPSNSSITDICIQQIRNLFPLL